MTIGVRMVRWAALGGLALLLPACSLTGGSSESPPPATGAAAAVEPAAPPAPAEPERPLAALPAPEAAPPNPEELFGLGSREVAELLGFPQLRRRENPAELWQYANQSCILDLFFAREDEQTRVAYVQLRSLNPVKMSRGQCLAELMQRPGRS
jgi:hypothetical protein